MRRIASDVGTGEGHERTVGLTEEDLAARAGTTVQRLRELIAIGLLPPGATGSEPFREGDPAGAACRTSRPLRYRAHQRRRRDRGRRAVALVPRQPPGAGASPRAGPRRS